VDRAFVVILTIDFDFDDSANDTEYTTRRVISYWNTYKPYVVAAAQVGADQMAIATECSRLQQHAPTTLWNQLIDRIRGVFAGTLTYDMNWDKL